MKRIKNATLEIFINNKSIVTFCVKNERTNNKLTFIVKSTKSGWDIIFRNFAIRNENYKHWTKLQNTVRNEKIGTVSLNSQYNRIFYPNRENCNEHWASRCFIWVMSHVIEKYEPPEHISVFYADKCQRCGRPLNDEASLHRGYGPVCAKKKT